MEGTIMEMATGKYPRKDGFTTEFFQNCCTVVETNVWKVIEDSRSTQGILQAFNSTFLSLIPKEGRDNSLDKFMSISLCNVIYKIISKVIANRLKQKMYRITSHEKGGYMNGARFWMGS